MRATQLNTKMVSTSANLLGHDVSYEQTNDIRLPPTTAVSGWQVGETLEHILPASSIDHDVFAESYYDVIWRPVLLVGARQPRTTYVDGGFEVAGVKTGNMVLNDAAVTNQVASANVYLNSNIKQDWPPLVMPLPPCSGFVPSQGFFHDLFSNVTWEMRNSGAINTIQGRSGTYQYASKILEILDSKCARYGTAKMAETHGAISCDFEDDFSSVNNSNYPDAPIVNVDPSLKDIWDSSRTYTIDNGSESFRASASAAMHGNYDWYARASVAGRSKLAIISGRTIGYDVLHENSEWLHLCLTVGRENPDVYNVFNIVPLNRPEDMCIASNFSTGKNAGEYRQRTNNPVSELSVWIEGPKWLGTLYNDGTEDTNPNNGLWGGGANTIVPIPSSLCTLRALAGCSTDYDQSSRACALYRNRQVVANSVYHHRYVWNTSGVTAGAYRLAVETYPNLQGKNAVDAPPVYYRNAYRPKEGIFGLDSDFPAYASKTVKIQLGNFSQAFVGCPLHDFNEYSKLYLERNTYNMNTFRTDVLAAFNAVPPSQPFVDARGAAIIRNQWVSGQNTSYVRLHSPFYNADVGVDVSYGIEFKRFDYIAHRHRVSVEVEATIRAAMMQNGLARYPVRRVETNLIPVTAASYLDVPLFDNTSADLVIVAVIRNQAINFSQSTSNSNLLNKFKYIINNSEAQLKDEAGNPRAKAMVNRMVNGNITDSLCTAPAVYQKCPLPAAYQIADDPSIPISELHLLVNGLKEPNLGYQPDAPSDASVQFGNDGIYRKVINEIRGAGYPDIADSLPRSVWESNVRIYPFNLTSSKFPIHNQGSNLPAKKSVHAHFEFSRTPEANVYSVVVLGITQQTELELDPSGNVQFVY